MQMNLASRMCKGIISKPIFWLLFTNQDPDFRVFPVDLHNGFEDISFGYQSVFVYGCLTTNEINLGRREHGERGQGAGSKGQGVWH